MHLPGAAYSRLWSTVGHLALPFLSLHRRYHPNPRSVLTRKLSRDEGSLHQVHGAPCEGKEHNDIRSEKAVFLSSFLGGEERLYFSSLCTESLKSTDKPPKVHTRVVMQSEQGPLHSQECNGKQGVPARTMVGHAKLLRDAALASWSLSQGR